MERVQIATIDDDRSAQRLLDAAEIGMPILVPVGDDGECVGIGQRVIAR